MKRSFNYSSVSISPAMVDNARPSHSFQHPATLAAQPPQLNIHSRQTTRNPQTQLYSDYLSPTDAAPRQPLVQQWYHHPNIQAPERQSLAGLGISMSPFATLDTQQFSTVAQPVSLPLRLPASPFSQTLNLPSLRELGLDDICLSSPVNGSCISRPYGDSFLDLRSPSIMVTEDVNTAYSPYPTDEFVAHSPSWNDGNLILSLDVGIRDDFMPDVGPGALVPYNKQPTSPTEPLIGLFADFNMWELALSQQQAPQTINTALLIDDEAGSGRDTEAENEADMDVDMDAYVRSRAPSPVLQYPEDSMETLLDDGDNVRFTSADVDIIMSVLSTSVVKEETEDLAISGALILRSNVSTPIILPYTNNQGLPVPPLPTRSGTIPPAPSPNPAYLLPMQPLAFMPKQLTDSPFIPGSPSPSEPDPNLALVLVPSPRVPLGDLTATVAANRDSVFNAHKGIELEELRAKVEEFRAQNPGEDIDKMWLATWAGKLSESGERLDEFRCYVKGCSQSNKRRDHILVHVGAHVEFRPFKCDFCDMRFLRKNECKRHMSSHGGLKPYICEICPPEKEKSFVRQDLLKRHIKVTHNQGGGSEYGRRRKRMKLDTQEGPKLLTYAEPQVPSSFCSFPPCSFTL
ncbi:hypothetical protein BXZ70DRAFT_917454 [Cristinia sonorae]|uniref:C2H2-type domain-containing protein n=1 Tax=Cristinia sonorae TaxID=1940300 RepID=A0A8K0XTJ0_9AGAR|nr:hypothetical protein BXZ70DRAFT_917454 [Cristinia sonorae]